MLSCTESKEKSVFFKYLIIFLTLEGESSSLSKEEEMRMHLRCDILSSE
jgi:hypothetical protein